jgi:hypothetical protein
MAVQGGNHEIFVNFNINVTVEANEYKNIEENNKFELYL